MKQHKLKLFIPVFLSIILSAGCGSTRKISDIIMLNDHEVIIIGLVEYDYSEMENHQITGVNLSLDSKAKHSRLPIPKEYLPKERLKKFEFISFVGDTGTYDLNCRHNAVSGTYSNPITENSFDVEDNGILERYRRYGVHDGKIIYLGKTLVKYTGGNVVNRRIKYEYDFYPVFTDTIALHAFRVSYPDLFNMYANEIIGFKTEFEQCIEYIILELPEEKSLLLRTLVNEHPDHLEDVFQDLNPEKKEIMLEKFMDLDTTEIKKLFE